MFLSSLWNIARFDKNLYLLYKIFVNSLEVSCVVFKLIFPGARWVTRASTRFKKTFIKTCNFWLYTWLGISFLPKSSADFDLARYPTL